MQEQSIGGGYCAKKLYAARKEVSGLHYSNKLGDKVK
jgi:hypothetical protein